MKASNTHDLLVGRAHLVGVDGVAGLLAELFLNGIETLVGVVLLLVKVSDEAVIVDRSQLHYLLAGLSLLCVGVHCVYW